jgi:nucleoside-diphosphate-sugar epimerase
MITSRIHVVLGGNGVAGRETVRALLARGERTISVGRRPSSLANVRSAIADLRDARQVTRALVGADVAYLAAGVPYTSRAWAEQWPQIVGSAIDAATAHGTHLVFLDNVYAYGPVTAPMTEQTPIAPSSKKGRVRAQLLGMLENAASRGLDVTIGRSADFYGPGASTSVFNTFALDRIAAGKRATWLFDADQPHSLTYTPDIGAALAVLGTAPEARGRTWHLPTAPPLTGREYIRLAAGPHARVGVMSAATIRMGALFNTPARETLEMAYQYTSPYLFDSHLFEEAFTCTPTPVVQAIAQSLAPTHATSRPPRPSDGDPTSDRNQRG